MASWSSCPFCVCYRGVQDVFLVRVGRVEHLLETLPRPRPQHSTWGGVGQTKDERYFNADKQEEEKQLGIWGEARGGEIELGMWGEARGGEIAGDMGRNGGDIEEK